MTFSDAYDKLKSLISEYITLNAISVIEVNHPYDLEQNKTTEFGYGILVRGSEKILTGNYQREMTLTVVSRYVQVEGTTSTRISVEKKVINLGKNILQYIAEKNCALQVNVVSDDGIEFTENEKHIYNNINFTILHE